MEIVTLAPRVYECTECGNQITTKTNHRGDNIEFDPIAWCCEFSEYDSFEQFQKDTGYTKDGVEHVGYPDIETVDDLREHTTVLIELDNGGIIVGEF